MEPIEAAAATGDALNALASHFMLDISTYAHGAELGFAGVDFYLAGRAGVLGDVPAPVVAASLVFFEPGYVAEAWERTRGVMPRDRASEEFIAVGHAWAEANIPNDFDSARLADLAGRAAAAASPASAPLFGAWRAAPEPPLDRPKALALHRMNVLRELRGAVHGAAVVTSGVTPFQAMARRSPHMLGIFGWGDRPKEETKAIRDEVRDAWDRAQEGTERAMAPAFAALSPTEREELVELANAVHAATSG